METRMEVGKIPKFRKLTREDRILIAQWEGQGFSLRQISKGWAGMLPPSA